MTSSFSIKEVSGDDDIHSHQPPSFIDSETSKLLVNHIPHHLSADSLLLRDGSLSSRLRFHRLRLETASRRVKAGPDRSLTHHPRRRPQELGRQTEPMVALDRGAPPDFTAEAHVELHLRRRHNLPHLAQQLDVLFLQQHHRRQLSHISRVLREHAQVPTDPVLQR
ncbi:hypothetical protein L249_1586 [Ophiocordyceps polyrhachis-furcata BCC 54312]|uniref:Uncharacterized protein n=1 Tax=Ophiocordyceps polyrhachis-furcata BCC 54312 TaxID=1330021 RepID=A0A367KZC4_9HYPO|nr:hypothetical protein L249_1586 [Ophiocordyceps polyrhachis-furcata BCC 54312]